MFAGAGFGIEPPGADARAVDGWAGLGLPDGCVVVVLELPAGEGGGAGCLFELDCGEDWLQPLAVFFQPPVVCAWGCAEGARDGCCG